MVRFAQRLAPGRAERDEAVSDRLPFLPTVLAVSLFLACVGAWFASARPDGLEWSLARVGALVPEGGSRAHLFLRALQRRTAFLPDYALPAPAQAAAAGPVKLDVSLAGGLGTLAAAGVTVAAGLALSRRGRRGGAQ